MLTEIKMFEFKRKINFYEADSAGIMFYGNIFRVIHEAYEEFLQTLQNDYFVKGDIVLPIAHAEADYFIPLKIHEKIEINLTVSNLQDRSFELSYDVLNDEGKTAIKAKTIHVCVDNKNFEKINLPADLRELLESNKQRD